MSQELFFSGEAAYKWIKAVEGARNWGFEESALRWWFLQVKKYTQCRSIYNGQKNVLIGSHSMAVRARKERADEPSHVVRK